MQKLKFLKPALVLLIIAVGVALLLSLVNFITKDKIVENTLREKNAAIEKIFTECKNPVSESVDKALIESLPSTVSDLGYVKSADGDNVGYYVEVAPVGFKDAISMIVGVSSDKTVVNVICLSSSETAGVGTKATGSDYLRNFISKNSDNVSDVDTITGATISSKAVKNGILNACRAVELLAEVE